MDKKKPKSAKAKTKAEKEEDKKKKRRLLIIIFIIIFIILSAGIGYLIFLLCKGCGPTPGPTPPTTQYNVTVVQPESKPTWELKANDKTGTFKVTDGERIDVTLKEKSSSNEVITNDEALYQVDVEYTDQTTHAQLHWNKSFVWDEQLSQYSTWFLMSFRSDIIISVKEQTVDGLLYIVDANEDKWYLNDTAYDIDSDIVVTKYGTETTKSYPRDEFNEHVYVGKGVSNINDHLLSKCTGFNSPITFDAPSQCNLIGECFLSNCTKFNQKLEFSDQLKYIKGNFLTNCTDFNNGSTTNEVNTLDFNKVEYLDFVESSSFMFKCTSFNSPIKIDNLIQLPRFFMNHCTSFNQPITIPACVTRITDCFMFECDNMTSTITINCPESAFEPIKYVQRVCSTTNKDAECFKQGIPIAGSAATYWKQCFPNLNPSKPGTEAYYRNLK